MGSTLSIAVELTVNCVVLKTPLKLAVIVAVPEASDAANPLEPDMLLIVATVGLEELQTTEFVISCVVLFE